MKVFKLIAVIFLTMIETEIVFSQIEVTEDCNCGQANEEATRRITNGQSTNPNKYPWIAGLVYILEDEREVVGCAGSIISNRNILTAANCFFEVDRKLDIFEQTFWTLGMHETGVFDEEAEYSTVQYFLHPKFSHFQSLDEADLVLATVDREIEFSDKIRPICLPTPGNNFQGKTAVVAGWGVNNMEDVEQSEVLMETSMNIIPNSKCRRMWRSRMGRAVTINEQLMVCAHRRGTDTCRGDSGTPLMVKSEKGFYELVGADSFGYKCDSRVPAVFAKISDPETMEWIQDYMEDIGAVVCNHPTEIVESEQAPDGPIHMNEDISENSTEAPASEDTPVHANEGNTENSTEAPVHANEGNTENLTEAPANDDAPVNANEGNMEYSTEAEVVSNNPVNMNEGIPENSIETTTYIYI